jgi:hypothetical protein
VKYLNFLGSTITTVARFSPAIKFRIACKKAEQPFNSNLG